MNAKQKLHQARLSEWAARFSDQKASGLTVRQWCEKNEISIHKYNYWKHQLREEVAFLPRISSVPRTRHVPARCSRRASCGSHKSRNSRKSHNSRDSRNIYERKCQALR